jgi:alanine racemase
MKTDYLHWIEISASALRHNAQIFRKHLGTKTKILAMVKANAYGHGIKLVCPVLAPHVDWFGVNTLDEALEIRSLDISTPILVCGPIATSRIPEAVKADISLCGHTTEYIKELVVHKAKIHLKINTGMNRLGIRVTEIPAALDLLPELEGLYTHFHSADSPGDSTSIQLKLFKQAQAQVKGKFPNVLSHCANSSAIFTHPDSHLDMARIGIGLYGLWPSDFIAQIKNYKLQPVLSWKAKIVQQRELLTNESVGYGASHKVLNPEKMAVIPVGYSDGLDRRMSNKKPFIGKIAMNFSCITDPGTTEFEIIGSSLSATDMAKTIDTINFEVLARLSAFIPRILV